MASLSDDYFDGEELDSVFLKEVDAIEAASQSPAVTRAQQPSAPARAQPPPTTKLLQQNDSFDDDYFSSVDIDPAELAKLDQIVEDAYAGGKPQVQPPIAGPSRLTRQLTLDGTVLPNAPPKSQAPSRPAANKPKYASTPLFGHRPQRVKTWDHTAFAETGKKLGKNKPKSKSGVKGKGKGRAVEEDEDEVDEEVEFEQFPDMPVAPSEPPPPMRLKPDLIAARNWVFPLNKPRRDYQFNIAKKCFFHNTLVALPTGLGKTFIAGVVMLNYYNWFPEGKIIFLAPTKPLVAQQVSACHDVCGIPGDDAAELTGSTDRSRRIPHFKTKRVFYMTPQTFTNDISSDALDPLDIILIVYDEAHRAQGNHSYAQSVRYMMIKNPHVRILALTATPGNKPEAVQKIVDALHISHIEIRNEESHDLQKYLFKKEINMHVIKMSEDVVRIRDLMCKLMQPLLKKVQSANLVHCQSPVTLHSYACLAALSTIRSRGSSLNWAYVDLTILADFSRAMAYLIESSVPACLSQLNELKRKLSERASKDSRHRGILQDPNFIKLIEECERQVALGVPHPKLEKLLSLLLSHFANAERGDGADGTDATQSSKAMIFVQYRSGVDEVIQYLRPHKLMLKPSRFVGQSKDRHGDKGMSQAEQLEVIKRFKAGEFNILVSTSIGEEGLDIGEIDRIICYETSKNAIRMLQRVGRTGRKRAGNVDVLLAEDREEKNWDKSKENYEDVQDTIIRGNDLELYGDVERLLPDSIDPQCLQTTMEIKPYVPPSKAGTEPRNTPTKGTKRKRNDDINRNIPLGAMTGFVTASELRPKSKRAKKAKDAYPTGIEDDSDDAAIAAGPCGTISKSKSKGKSTKKSTGTSKGVKTKSLKSIPVSLEDDDDDLDIEIGVSKTKKGAKARTSLLSDSSDLETSTPLTTKQKTQRLIELTSSPDSPIRGSDRTNHGGAPASSGATTAPASSMTKRKENKKWLFGLSDSDDDESRPSTSKTTSHVMSKALKFRSAKTELKKTSPSPPPPISSDDVMQPPEVRGMVCPLRDKDTNGKPVESPVIPEPTYAVQRPAKRKPLIVPPSSPAADFDENVPRRLVRRDSPALMPPPPPPLAPKNKKAKLRMTSNPALFDVEAEHSGEDVSEGGSDVDMVESDSDRRFLEEPEESQISLSYNQTAAYRIGLMTQLPTEMDGPRFAMRPKRTGPFAGGRTQAQKQFDLSSSPARTNELDEYEMGSFVVHDDDTILYENSSEP